MERPGPDADVDEIARWMEADFWEGIAEAAEEAADDSDQTESD